MTPRFEAVTAEAIRDAQRPEEIFGDVRDGDALGRVYRSIARGYHPDLGGDEEVFKRLGTLYESAKRRMEDGRYGTDAADPLDPLIIRSRRNAYRVLTHLRSGEIADTYRVSYINADDHEAAALLKVVRHPRNNDLMTAEAKTLKRLLTNTEVFDVIEPYLPGYIETFGFRGKGAARRKPRQATVFREIDGLYSLHQVRARYPRGVHAKDMAWMFRRLLLSLGVIHTTGLVHGALVPQHILIHATQHGLVLTGWCHAVDAGQVMESIPSGTRALYPEEVLEKREVMAGTDVFLAARSMVYVLGGDPETGRMPDHVAPPLRAFLNGCALRWVKRRPQDCLDLMDEFTELVERLWGPRTFRPFDMG